MRAMSYLSGLLAATVLVNPLLAQVPAPAASNAVVSDTTAEVSSARGTGPYSSVTNQLKHGDAVEVVTDYGDGWLGIRAPAGSVSWINKQYVKQPAARNPFDLVVDAGQSVSVPVFMGSAITPKTRFAVEGCKGTYGTLVRAIPDTANLVDQEGEWVAIESPWTEVRYIRADKVTRQNPGQVVPGGAIGTSLAAPNPGFSGVVAAAAPPALSVVEQLWQRAMQAERAGRVAEAIQIYSEMASQTTGNQHDLAMQGLNRAYWLQQAQRNAAPSPVPQPPPLPQQPQQPQQPQRVVMATPASEVRYAPTSSNSQFVPSPATDPYGQPVRLVAPCGTGTTPGVAAQPEVRQTASAPWQAVTREGYPTSGPGVLRRAGRFINNHKTYVLESNQGYPRLYVTPHEGVDLEPYLNRYVELFGPAIYDGNLRANYMTVVRVQPLQ